jgi:hypothetical protein
MDYNKHYNRLIEKAAARPVNIGTYYEKHHIIPKSEGGQDNKSNLVMLTAREHFIAHWLLYRADPTIPSRIFSFWRMCNGRGKVPAENWIIVPSRAYEEARFAHSKAISNKLKGRKKSPEHVAKVVAATTGLKRTPEARARMSDAAKKRGISSGFYTLLERAAEAREKQKIRVAMINPVTGEIVKAFQSLKEAAEYVNRDIANISVAIKKGSTCANYQWIKYEN